MHHLIKKIIKDTSSLSTQEAWWLLEHISGKSQANLIAANDPSLVDIDQLERFLTQIKHDKMPLSYILGFLPFLDLKIQVISPILIPRPETEEWVERAIQLFAPVKDQINRILDIGTGSGCIAIALAAHFPKAHITAIDINPEALVLAQKNATLNNIKNIEFLQSNLFEKLQNQKFDLIVSNPPYIDPAQLSNLPIEVSAWEDHKALFAHDAGLAIINQILTDSASFLKINQNLPAQLIMEIGHDQKDAVLKLAKQFDWSAEMVKDLFGKWRTIWCTKD